MFCQILFAVLRMPDGVFLEVASLFIAIACGVAVVALEVYSRMAGARLLPYRKCLKMSPNFPQGSTAIGMRTSFDLIISPIIWSPERVRPVNLLVAPLTRTNLPFSPSLKRIIVLLFGAALES